MAFPGLAQKTRRGTLWAPSYYVGTSRQKRSDTISRSVKITREGVEKSISVKKHSEEIIIAKELSAFVPN